jgi:hypothetical protein
MAGSTQNPVKLGPPRWLRMQHAIVNAQMYIVAQDIPMPNHFWMIERISVTLQANAAVSGTPPVVNLYSAPTGVFESASGVLQGVTLMVSPNPQSGDLILLDSGAFSITGATNIWPYLVADEDKRIMVPENRVLVAYIGGYTTTAAVGMAQVEIQYEDWIKDVPKNSPMPVKEDSVNAESA